MMINYRVFDDLRRTQRTPRLSTLAALCCGILFLSAACSIADGQVLTTDFTTDPMAAGWTYTGIASEGWSAGDGFITAADDGGTTQTWRSPEFAVTPSTYYEVTFTATAASPGYVSAVDGNPSTTWGTIPPSTDLIADDYTSVPSAATWTQSTFFTHTQPNATQAAITFSSIGSNVNVQSVTVSTASSDAAVAAWDDSIYAQMTPVTYTPPANRFTNLARTYSKLLSGSPLNIVMLGDSIMNDTANSTFETLVERQYPGSKINVSAAVGGGAGMAQWDPDSPDHVSYLNLQQAVINQKPDLVVIGGISNGTAYSDITNVINLVRSGVQSEYGYTPDILLLTPEFGSGNNPLAPGSTWYPTIDPNGTDYRSTLYQIAQSEQTGFLDMDGAWGQYMIDAQGGVYNPTVYNSFFRDADHANTFGKEITAQILNDYFTPLPEPNALVMAIGACALLRRRRRATD